MKTTIIISALLFFSILVNFKQKNDFKNIKIKVSENYELYKGKLPYTPDDISVIWWNGYVKGQLNGQEAVMKMVRGNSSDVANNWSSIQRRIDSLEFIKTMPTTY